MKKGAYVFGEVFALVVAACIGYGYFILTEMDRCWSGGCHHLQKQEPQSISYVIMGILLLVLIVSAFSMKMKGVHALIVLLIGVLYTLFLAYLFQMVSV